MFDPTIFENLKVVIEGEIYDRDLVGEITIVERKDNVNLATLSRDYSLTFKRAASSPYRATIKLAADSNDLYGEILEKSGQHGCKLLLFIEGPIQNINSTSANIQKKLVLLWGKRPNINHKIYYDWSESEHIQYFFKTSLQFDRKINEDQIDDFSEIINLLYESLLIIEKIID